MPKYFSLLSAVILACIFSSAGLAVEGDYYIEQMSIMVSSFQGNTDTTFNKIWVSGDKVYQEQGGVENISIGRLDKGLFWIIDLDQKTYSEIDLATMRKLGIMGLAMMGAQMDKDGNLTVPDDLYKKTQEEKKINGWNASKIELNPKYAANSLVQKFEMWVSKDIDVPMGFYSEMMKNVFGDPNGEVKKLLKIWSEMDGYPVKIVMETMGVSTITLTTKVEKKDAPEGIFNLPSGLTEVSNPMFDQMNNMQGR